MEEKSVTQADFERALFTPSIFMYLFLEFSAYTSLFFYKIKSCALVTVLLFLNSKIETKFCSIQ